MGLLIPAIIVLTFAIFYETQRERKRFLNKSVDFLEANYNRIEDNPGVIFNKNEIPNDINIYELDTQNEHLFSLTENVVNIELKSVQYFHSPKFKEVFKASTKNMFFKYNSFYEKGETHLFVPFQIENGYYKTFVFTKKRKDILDSIVNTKRHI